MGIPCDSSIAGYRALSLMEMNHIEWLRSAHLISSEAEMVGMQALSGEPGDVRAIHAVLHAMEAKVGAMSGLDAGPSARRTSPS